MRIRRRRQSGATLIETALSLSIFLAVIFGVIEFSRAMFAWNTAAEATRMAARLASICEYSAAQQNKIRNRVQLFVEASGQAKVSDVAGDWLVFSYYPNGCDANSCTSVEARLTGLKLELLFPFYDAQIPLPEYRTRAVRETMGNSIVVPSLSSPGTSDTISNETCS
jgi:hypothetical protein